MKFGYLEPSKIMFDFWKKNFGGEVFDSVSKGPPLWNIVIFDELYFFGKTRWLYGVKSVLPFSKLIIGKNQVFSTRWYVYLLGYTQICDRGRHNVPPVGVNRVKWTHKNWSCRTNGSMLNFIVAFQRYFMSLAHGAGIDCKTFTTQTFTTPDVHHPQCKIRRSPPPV